MGAFVGYSCRSLRLSFRLIIHLSPKADKDVVSDQPNSGLVTRQSFIKNHPVHHMSLGTLLHYFNGEDTCRTAENLRLRYADIAVTCHALRDGPALFIISPAYVVSYKSKCRSRKNEQVHQINIPRSIPDKLSIFILFSKVISEAVKGLPGI